MANNLPPTPGLAFFRSSLPSWPVDKSTEYLIALLRRRQIRGAKSCALATAWLLRKVTSTTRAGDPEKLLKRIQEVGSRLIEAAPRELVVGNVVRRVLGAIREEQENRGVNEVFGSTDFSSLLPTPVIEVSPASMSPRREPDTIVGRPALLSQQTGVIEKRPIVTSMFSIMSHPTMRTSSGTSSPLRSEVSTPVVNSQQTSTDFRAEVLEAITEIVDELDQADEQVASYALEHIAPQEIIFTYSSSTTVQRFLLKAATKRKFTVIHAEAYPNGYERTHALVAGNRLTDEEDDLDSNTFQKPLIAAGVTVLLVPDSAAFALISRASKLVLSADAVLSNGSFIASAGSKLLVRAAKHHNVPVLVLAESYKLSPLYPFDPYDFIDYGDLSKAIPYQDRELNLGLKDSKNPLTDFVDGQDVDLFVTNLGGFASDYMYRIVKDQYRDEDVNVLTN